MDLLSCWNFGWIILHYDHEIIFCLSVCFIAYTFLHFIYFAPRYCILAYWLMLFVFITSLNEYYSILSLYWYKSQYFAWWVRILPDNRSLFHGPNGIRHWWKWNSLQRSQSDTGGASLRKVLMSLHHIASTDNFQIHTTQRWRYDTHDTPKKRASCWPRHPGGGYSLYDDYYICGSFDPTFRSLENVFSFDPCIWEI